MAKHEVLAGQTDYTALVFIPDPASTDGSGKTGLVAANLTVSFVRVETDNDVTVTDATGSLNDLALLTSAHADWGLLEVSNTLAPGTYRLDIADAVFATGAWSAVVYVMITTSAAAASPMEFVMVPNPPLTGVLLAPTTHTSAVIPTVTTTGTATAVTTVNGLAAGVITATAIADGAIDAATFAAGAINAAAIADGAIDAATFAAGAIDAAALAADAGTEIGSAVWASATRTLTSLAGLTVDTVTTLTNKTGFSLASTGLNLVIPADPGTTLPSFAGNSTLVQWIAYFGAWSVNPVESDSAEARLRNTADNDNLAQHALADSGTEFTSGAAT